jgi:hypothetical protein
MRKAPALFTLLLVISTTGCFRVGRLHATTNGGPGYDDPKSAILVPVGAQTEILAVNNELVRSDFVDRLANLALQPLLMYLEPRVYIKPGKNKVLIRAKEETTTDFGTFTRTTITWRDYTISVNAKAGETYHARADLDDGAKIALRSTDTRVQTAAR